jgi:hypothetical protein
MHYSRHNGLVKRFLDSNSRKAVRIIFTMALDLETYLPELPIVGETSRFVSAPFALSSTQWIDLHVRTLVFFEAGLLYMCFKTVLLNDVFENTNPLAVE